MKKQRTAAQSRIEELKEKHAREIAALENENTILSMIPEGVPLPLVCNEDADPAPWEDHAWLCFSGPAYDPDKTWDPVALLKGLEDAGWALLPASLVKRADYRPSPLIGKYDTIPETLPGCSTRSAPDPVKFADPIAPVWIDPNQYTAPEFEMNMCAPDGRRFKVAVRIPGLPVFIGAKRMNPHSGDWYYVRGTCTLSHPQAWHALPEIGLEKSHRTQAQVDTEQGISGRLFFNLTDHEQEAYPHPASVILAALLTAK